MAELSEIYARTKQLRSCGNCPRAIETLRTSPPASDFDALEAVVCLFVCGDMTSALHVCRTHRWTEQWGADIASAILESRAGAEPTRALSLARRAAACADAPADALAFYLLLLQQNGCSEEAYRYITTQLQQVPSGESFLLAAMAEVATSVRSWREAYRLACAVLACDPDDYRALIVLSTVSYELGNVHESLGHATRANILRRGSPPSILQLMRCRNELGNHYAAIAAFDTLDSSFQIPSEIRIELGRAYGGLGDCERALSEYRVALDSDPSSVVALRVLVASYATEGRQSELNALIRAHHDRLHRDFESVHALGLEALARADIDVAANLFARSHVLAQENGDLHDALVWPVGEPRIRHDIEQLELLKSRGKLEDAGCGALDVLRRCLQDHAHGERSLAPEGTDGERLRAALCTTFYRPECSIAGPTLAQKDYVAVEERYLSNRLVVIDDFLTPEALDALRQFCEEATVWKFSYERGYVGARLAHGFSPKVLLTASDELKKRMPRVIGARHLTHAWAFKYDQRMQGINLHADFAEVNVNFWITPDDACTDRRTGGMVVYDLPVPRSWTFFEYNNESEKLCVYLRQNNASCQRIPYRANRCVLFDSSLIHTSDEMHFKPSYENRRVNVTLLYGKPRNAE